jgi:hypothetical protein
VELVASGDVDAFKLLLKSDPGVFELQPGMEVTLVDSQGTLGSVVKVRKRGTLAEFWTVSRSF